MEGGARLVGIYLQDHLAGSVVALELLGRSRRRNEGTELGSFLAGLEQEIQEDRATLLTIMDTLAVEPSRVKNGLAWTVEKVGRLKLNGRLARRSPLSTLLELEALEAGISGKRSLWTSLPAIAHPRLAAFDFPLLTARAEVQIAAVEQWKLRAAAALRGAG